jgi:probable HAF family extracellular repeat protein
VVGFSYTSGGGSSHGFLYDNGHIVDLNSLLTTTDASLYTITSGSAINDNGQILAYGILDSTGQAQAFLLSMSPAVPLPASIWLMLGGLGGCALFARGGRKRRA